MKYRIIDQYHYYPISIRFLRSVNYLNHLNIFNNNQYGFRSHHSTLLFLLYYNDFPDYVKHSKILMFADDTVLWYESSSCEDIEHMLNQDLQHVAEYFRDNDLVINLKQGKTESMLFGTAKRISKERNQLDLVYKGQQINSTSCYKYLGSKLDQHLTLTDNFNTTYKVSGRIKLLYKLKSSLTMEAIDSIYEMVIVPVIRYNCNINLNLTMTQKEKLRSFTSRVKSMVNKTKIMSIENELKRHACNEVRKCIDKKVCQHFLNLFRTK